MTVTRPMGLTTRFIGPTNSKGSRVKVTVWGESKIFPYDYASEDASGNAHRAAALAMIDYLGYELANDPMSSLQWVADSESGRGSVYVVEFVGKVRT